MPLRRIDSVEELHRYLRAALVLEHATIPPYLTALYSIKPGTNLESVAVLRSVVVEEMLHITLVANLMNALGEHPDLTTPGFVPHYPTNLPDGETDFEVSLHPFGRASIETFMRIERPSESTDTRWVRRDRSDRALLPAYIHDDDADLHFFSVGQFYGEIEQGLRSLSQSVGTEQLFIGDPAHQVVVGDYFPGASAVGPVVDLDSALVAIDCITEQGEGLGERIFDEFDELSHYYRLEQIVRRRFYERGDIPGVPRGGPFRVDWSTVHALKVDARIEEYAPGTELRRLVDEFSAGYDTLLAVLTEAFSGSPTRLDEAFGAMFKLRETFRALAACPHPTEPGRCAAPVFGHSLDLEVEHTDA